MPISGWYVQGDRPQEPTSLSLLGGDLHPLQEIARLDQPPAEKESWVRPAPCPTHCLPGKAGRETGQPYSQPFTRPQPASNSGQSWACQTKHILDKPTEAAPSHEKGLSGEKQNRTVPLGGAGQ